jgi:hypothetical protein
MLPRKIKVWWIKRKLRLKREEQILTIPDIINLEQEAHNTHLAHDRHGKREDATYWKGRRDGINSIWKQRVR